MKQMTETRTFCDCCGVEVGGWGDKELYVAMTVGKSGTAHYCFGCAKELLEAWNKKTEEIQNKVKSVTCND